MSSWNRANALTTLGIILLVVSATILGSQYFGHGRTGRTLSSASLPSGLGPGPTRAPLISRTPARPPAAQDQPGVPVTIIVADHHVRSSVSADRLNTDGSLHVPLNPQVVSWSSQHAAPGTHRGTIILVGHVNYGGVAGAFVDLADYRVGQIITLVLADGRRMKYAVAAPPIDVKKNELGPRRQELFDQSHSYALGGSPESGRLLLLSCGGVFDNRTGHYESNIFAYALPA
jgi:hypothetical protein